MDIGDIPITESENPVIRNCSAATREMLLERGQVRQFESGSMLLQDGQAAGMVLFPLHGAIQMGKVTPHGRRQIICNATSESCGGLCMLAFGANALSDARGLDSGAVLMLERADFEALIHQDGALCRAAWESAAHCMAHLSALVSQLSFNKVPERVILALLENTVQNGDAVRLTQADLAAEVGTTREVVARCLAGFQLDGLIRLGRARITVLDREGLNRHLS